MVTCGHIPIIKQNAGNVAEIAYQVGFSDHARLRT